MHVACATDITRSGDESSSTPKYGIGCLALVKSQYGDQSILNEYFNFDPRRNAELLHVCTRPPPPLLVLACPFWGTGMGWGQKPFLRLRAAMRLFGAAS